LEYSAVSHWLLLNLGQAIEKLANTHSRCIDCGSAEGAALEAAELPRRHEHKPI
jgi:hypothetical protein